MYLQSKDEQDHTGVESYVWKKFLSQQTSWFPIYIEDQEKDD